METFSDALEPVLEVDEVVALEKRIAAAGTSLSTLMERAGEALAEAAEVLIAPGERVCVLCGSGNNGGDGWVAARLLARAGHPVVLAAKRPAADIGPEPAHTQAEKTIDALEEQRLDIELLVNPGASSVSSKLVDCALVIDAVLGTGFDGDVVREPYAGWIEAANDLHGKGALKTLAADVPSGLSARTGSCARPTFAADETVTMLAVKTGLLAPGADKVTGRILLAPLGIEQPR